MQTSWNVSNKYVGKWVDTHKKQGPAKSSDGMLKAFKIIKFVLIFCYLKQCLSTEFAKNLIAWEKNSNKSFTWWKVSKYEVFSGPYFPAFGLSISPYSVRMRENNNSVFGHFSCSARYRLFCPTVKLRKLQRKTNYTWQN